MPIKQFDRLTSKDLSSIGDFGYLGNGVFVVSIDGKDYLIKRYGKCNPKTCNSACCKFTSNCIHFYNDGNSNKLYLMNFGNTKVSKNKLSVLRICKCHQLDRNGKCLLWNTKRFPDECKEFPHPHDGVYIEVSEKCTFYFCYLRRCYPIDEI